MSSSIFKVLRQCLNCGEMFESQKVTTKYCSHKCNQKHYKLRKRLEKKQNTEAEVLKQSKVKPKIKAIDLAFIKDKEFLSVNEVALLFGCNKKTVYRMIENKVLNAVNLNHRMTKIRRIDIDDLFNNSIPKPNKKVNLKIDDCYSISEIKEKYKVSDNGLRAMAKRNKIPKTYIQRFAYYPKKEIDALFSL
ncbi:helix-turn-helix domain-containing protein [Tenacibaculum ovolyticum]|uniref:helix-turn-helix domain-containing protein n=1 Tax=Tenacibaculum ovolyticum TaxID=104270 RepID=UPI003BAA3F3A